MSYNCGDLFTQDLLDGKEPQVMLYDRPNCSLSSNQATPLKLARKGMVYSDMYDVGMMGDSNIVSLIERNLPADIEQVYPGSIRMVDAQSLYVPPHMEVDYTTAPSMAFGANMKFDATDQTHNYDWQSIDGTFTYAGADDGRGGYNNLRDPNFQSPQLTATTMYGTGVVNRSAPFSTEDQPYYASNLYGGSYLNARVDIPGYDTDFVTGDWSTTFDSSQADNLFMRKVVSACCDDPGSNSICDSVFDQGIDCTRQDDPTMFYHFQSEAPQGWEPHRGMRTMIVRQKKPWAQFRKDCCTADSQALDFGNDTQGAANACGIFWGPNDDQGACDAVMKDWCHWNSDSEECLCITSTMANPQCWDPQCALGQYSYKNNAQKNILAKHCPAENVCTQTINEGDNSKDNIMNNVVMQQDCATALNSLNNNPATSGAMGRMCYQYFKQLLANDGALTFTPDPVLAKQCTDNYSAIMKKYSGMSCNGGSCDISTAAQAPPTGTWPSGFPAVDDPAWSKLNTADSAQTDNVALEAMIVLTFISIFLTAVYILSSIHFLSDNDDAQVLERKEIRRTPQS